MSLTLERVPEEGKPTVAHLLQLCLHDYTEYDPFAVGENGLFRYEWLDAYWIEPGRFPYLFRLGAEIVGFALVRTLEFEPWDVEISEFFILRSHRKKRIGHEAAGLLLKTQCGLWEISYDIRNLPARAFWSNVVREYDPLLKPVLVTGSRERYTLKVQHEQGI